MNKSKRKSENTIENKAKKKRMSNDDVFNDGTILCKMLNKAGLTLKKNGHLNILITDQAVFQRNLLLALKRHENYPQVIDEFISNFQEYVEDSSRFYHCLLSTMTSSECDSARGSHQDCLVRILLGIDILQPKLMQCLLEKLAEFMGDDEAIFEHGEKINLPRLLMSQFKWLDRIVNSKELAEKMIEMISIVALDVQREIISCLPEVVEDSEHAEVAKSLKDLLIENSNLTVPVLDALSNLTLNNDLLLEVRGTVMQTLSFVEMDDLPVVVKFLQQIMTSTDALEIVKEIRKNIDFSCSFPPRCSSTQIQDKSNCRNETKRGVAMIILDAIKSGVRFQKCVAEAWIKAIESVKLPSDHKVIDIFVLLILHSSNHKKPVESLLRNKIRSGCLTEILLQGAFGAHSQVMREYFQSILSLCEILLRSIEPAVVYFACSMYKNAFVSFDAYCQQEIVGNLVTHTGSGIEAEIDSALDILSDLIEHHLSKMSVFAIFVKGVLDYLDNLSLAQIRKLYAMLSIMAFKDPGQGALIQDDLHMLIRKQLSNNTQKYKRMGVIGAISIIKSLAESSDHVQVDAAEVDKVPMKDENYKQVITLLQLVKAKSSEIPEVSALFMDELASIIAKGCLDAKVENWISENVITDFQDDYVIDVEELSNQEETCIPFELKYGLDDEGEGSIALNVIPLAEKNHDDRKSKSATCTKLSPVLMCLPPHFRLLQVCEKRLQSNLENIDALLGCPIILNKPEAIDKFESLSQKEKSIVCESLFYTLNWFREVINAFATQEDPEMKGKIITRLQNMTELCRTLEQCLAVYPTFQPPAANFDWSEVSTPSIQIENGNNKKTSVKKTKKKKKGKENVECGDSDEGRDNNSTIFDKTNHQNITDTQALEKSTDKVIVDLGLYRPFFRELDLDVFNILNTGVTTEKLLDMDLSTKAATEHSLQPKQLEFLLGDLTCKLNHVLIASKSKKRIFLKSKPGKNIGFSKLDELTARQVVERVVDFLPAICSHLESTSGFFQTMISENDGLLDGPGSNSPESLLMASCFCSLLQALLSLFSWNGFVITENKGLLKSALEVLVGRIKSSSTTQIGWTEIIKNAFHYILNFAASVPNLSSAVIILKLLSSLKEKAESVKLTEKIVKQAEEFLKREWFGTDGQLEKGAKYNENLHFILKLFLTSSEDTLAGIEKITTQGIPELLDSGDKNASSASYPTMSRSSFSVFFRVIFAELVECVKTITAGKQTDTKEVKLEKLLKWNQAVRLLHILVNLIKVFDSRAILGAALKHGRIFVDIFLRQGMPLLDLMFRTNKEDVQGLLKNLQLSTRTLHHMGSHSKIIKDISLTNQVPFLKKSLEAFVYRVKAMLTMNKCHEAFWLGNLKNRDLKGEEILSQSSEASESTAGNQSDDNEEGEEEDESDVELDAPSEAGSDNGEDSYSQHY